MRALHAGLDTPTGRKNRIIKHSTNTQCGKIDQVRQFYKKTFGMKFNVEKITENTDKGDKVYPEKNIFCLTDLIKNSYIFIKIRVYFKKIKIKINAKFII